MLDGVNKELLPIKAHYFLFSAATAPIVQFLPVIIKQLGFSATLVGTIYTVLPISGFVAKPLFGGLADKFRLHKTLFILFQAVIVVSAFCINFIPSVERRANVTLTCDGLAFLEICSKDGFPASDLQSVLLTKSYNSSCQVSCTVPPNFHQAICRYWHRQELCDENSTRAPTGFETFDFLASFDMYQDLHIGKCVDLRILHATFPDGFTHAPVCPSPLRTSCLTECSQNPALEQLLQHVPAGQQSWTYQFYLLLSTTVLNWVGMAVVVSIADAICFNLLGSEKRGEYGRQRMWGSIGFGIFGTSAGYLVDVFSHGQAPKDYTCVFYIMLCAMITNICVSATLIKKTPDCPSGNETSLKELLTTAVSTRMLVFTWWCIGTGMCTGVVWNFLFWYIEDLAAGDGTKWMKTLQGLLTGIQCFLGDLPFNFMCGSLLRKLGHINVMSLILLVYAIRFMSYSLVSNPWMFLLVEVLHGPSLGLTWPAMASYGDKVTAPGSRATVQGFVGAVFEGVGVSSGSLLCGWLIDSYGGVTTFRVFSVGALLWLTIFWLLHVVLRKIQAYPIYQGHNHLASYAPPDDAVLMTVSQELQTY